MKYIFLGLITMSASPVGHISLQKFFIVWNVGQGQWATFVDSENCLHFDIGGETFPWKKVRSLCEQKQNRIYLSHWDWDHIGGLSRWPWGWSRHKVCISLRPSGTSSRKKMKLINEIQRCQETQKGLNIWTPRKAKNSNSQSHVLSFNKILLPGDSPVSQESHWGTSSVLTKEVSLLVLGHHGSATSTSEGLLKRLPHLRVAISSARWHRYGHPHPDVLARLRRAQVPLLRTEDWGHLYFQQ